MESLALQIDGKWAVLDDDVSISIEETSPIWGEGSSFSFPFELDVESNRHIIGNSDQITGDSVYKVLDNKEAVLYVLGIPLYYGKISLEDEVEINEGKIDVTLISGRMLFDEMIDGMNCQDVELMDELCVGRTVDSVTGIFNNTMDTSEYIDPTVCIPTPDGKSLYITMPLEEKRFILHKDQNNKSTINYSEPYPKKKYCNIPVCTQKKKEVKESGEKTKKEVEVLEYVKFPADRSGTGICFYVMYFFDCLLKQLGISVEENHMMDIEDMGRLAFFSTACEYKKKGETAIDIPSDYKIKEIEMARKGFQTREYTDMIGLNGRYIYATSKNFPDEDVSTVYESICNAFGILFLYSVKNNSMRIVYIKDILRNNSIRNIVADVVEQQKQESKIEGFILKYESSNEDDTNFVYKDYSQINIRDKFDVIRKNVRAYDKTLYIDQTTGDAYRIKIEEEAISDTTKNLNPSLFEVAQFCPATYGNTDSSDMLIEKKISFNPVIPNDISDVDGVAEYVVFLDVDMGKYKEIERKISNKGEYGASMVEVPDPSVPGDSAPIIVTVQPFTQLGLNITFKGYDYENTQEVGSPINQYDTGFTLGILRPGSDDKVVDQDADYDGENNSRYTTISANNAFVSDSIDNYGNQYDYNGEESGGVNVSGHISLKLRAEKPNPSGGFYPIIEPLNQKRGLFDKFWSEYAYWVVNRKIIKMLLRMEIADLVNIDWTIRYKIGNHIGFINKFSYSVNKNGLSDVELEMYYL